MVLMNYMWISSGVVHFLYTFTLMAVIQFGSIVTQGAGAIGGQVIQRGRSSQILKQKGRQSVRRGSVNQPPRTKLAAVASTWRDLSSGDRGTWESTALTITRINRFGIAYVPTGYQLFMELNSNLQNFGSQAIIETAPAAPNYPSVDNWSVDCDPSVDLFDLFWNQVSGDVDFEMYVSFFPLQSLGAAFVRGSARSAAFSKPVSDGGMSLFTQLVKRFPFLTAGNAQVAMAIDGVQDSTGWRMPRVVLMVPYVNP